VKREISNTSRGSIFIAGPTAVGKSAVALALAEKIGGEIISVDSMQVYRGLDIGTAKPTIAERTKIPHHLIDVAELTEQFDAAKFCKLAVHAENAIRSRGHLPIFCGGTGLYIQAYMNGLGSAPSADEALRGELKQTPIANLLHELEEKDPVTFAKIDQKNPRRVIRAIEVIRLTGNPFSQQRAEWQTAMSNTQCQLFSLSRSREDLLRRIDLRVKEMFSLGLVGETRVLIKQGLEKNKTAMQAIGYRQVVEYLRGERSLEETVELVKVKTRQYAKRQMTWFRRQLNLRWIDLEPKASIEGVVEKILAGDERNIATAPVER
jgi:tRNA dimethylallyltransferase